LVRRLCILNECYLIFIASTLVSLVVISGFKDAILQDSPTALEHVDYCWRILIGAGCIPGIVALYFRLTVPETPRFTMDIERNVKKACRNIEAVLSANGVAPGVWCVDPEASTERSDAPKASVRDFRRYFGQWKNARVLLGTAYSWFALDVRTRFTFEGGEFNSHVISRLDCILWTWPELFQNLHVENSLRVGIRF
jgi:PHS family inorganic phosphate transporter-like MFS transporter